MINDNQLDNALDRAEELISRSLTHSRNLKRDYAYMYEAPPDPVLEAEFVDDDESRQLAPRLTDFEPGDIEQRILREEAEILNEDGI